MKKLLVVVLIVLVLPVCAVAGDSISVAVRVAENVVGTNPVPDSIWNGWANEGYQLCLADGYALLRQAFINIKPYALPDSDNYALPSNFIGWVGARVVSGDDKNQRDVKLVPFGQGQQLKSGYGGRLELCTINDDSIQFFPHPSRYDTVLIYYYATDGALADAGLMLISSSYTPIIANYMLSRFYDKYENYAASDRYFAKFKGQLDRRLVLRRREMADLILMPKKVER